MIDDANDNMWHLVHRPGPGNGYWRLRSGKTHHPTSKPLLTLEQIYRCYVVYARRWLIVAPSLLLYLGGVAMAIKLIHAELHLGHGGSSLLEGSLQPWWRAFFAITAVQNGMTTGMFLNNIHNVPVSN